ncbi:MAG: hypothetical protein ABH821_05075 [archaeon]
MNKSKGKIIVFEGVDSSGKATQAKLLQNYFNSLNVSSELISFPRYHEFFGGLCGQYLQGKFGGRKELPPEVYCLLLSLDRYHMKNQIQEIIDSGKNIIFDRYIQSNYGFQPANFSDEKQQNEFLLWVKNLESRMPKEDLIFFLNADIQVVNKLMDSRENAKHSEIKKDINEKDLAFLERVKKVYLKLAREEPNWIVIDCVKQENNQLVMRSREEIHKEVVSKLKQRFPDLF